MTLSKYFQNKFCHEKHCEERICPSLVHKGIVARMTINQEIVRVIKHIDGEGISNNDDKDEPTEPRGCIQFFSRNLDSFEISRYQ
jgi:hypothetical protein